MALGDWSGLAFAGTTMAVGLIAPRVLGSECSAPLLHLELPSGRDWAAAAEDLEWRLRGAQHLDRCARVTVEREGAQVSVEVTTADGRRAKRLIARPSELTRAVEALLVLPPPLPEPEQSEVAPAPERVPDAFARPAPSGVPHASVRVGAGAMARLAGGATYAGGGMAMFAAVGFSGWQLDLAARWEVVDALVHSPTPAGFEMQSEALGIALGRTLELSSAELALELGPSLIFESQEADGPDQEGLGGETSDVRFDGIARLSLPRGDGFRFYAAADLEGSPSRLVHPRRLDPGLPYLPSWSAGLVTGVLWQAP